MTSINSFARLAALLGDTTRASMLFALMDGRALTAGELARAAGISPAAASAQLAQLTDAAFIEPTRQGRHRYFRISSSDHAGMIESLMCFAGRTNPIDLPALGPHDVALRRARVCYDHLAGELGVAITDALKDLGYVDLRGERASITEAGLRYLSDQDILAGPAPGKRGRPLCRACLDWSERRYHLGGQLGRDLLTHMLNHRWVVRGDVPRSLEVTRKGQGEIKRVFGLSTSA
jgi:DNA-binding transcriptional ArsR family regulator